VPLTPLAAWSFAPLPAVTGNQKLRQLPVHLMAPLASCTDEYSVFPDESVSTMPTPGSLCSLTVIPLAEPCWPLAPVP
jgi:hypothetical protein